MTYKVMVNHEGQYSIRFGDREPLLGWREFGKSGPKSESLAYIKKAWTDMRTLSLRRNMEEQARQEGVAVEAHRNRSPIRRASGEKLA